MNDCMTCMLLFITKCNYNPEFTVSVTTVVVINIFLVVAVIKFPLASKSLLQYYYITAYCTFCVEVEN